MDALVPGMMMISVAVMAMLVFAGFNYRDRCRSRRYRRRYF